MLPRYLLHHAFALLVTLLGITMLCFAVLQLAPGSPGDTMTDLNPKISPALVEQLRAHYGLDQPLHQQYLTWLGKLLQGDFGLSFVDNQPVLAKILAALPVTLVMNILGLVVVFVLALPIGLVAARYQDGVFDKTSTLLLFIAFAAPSFWLGLLAMQFFGVTLGLLPIAGLRSYGAEHWPLAAQLLDYLHHLVMPITLGVLGALAGMTRYLRATLLEVIRQDYITTARMKGASEARILYRHALPNALLPVITILGLSLPGLIGGSVIMESLFAIPGMGKLFYDGIMMRDYPLIMGVLTLGAILTLAGNLLADLCYSMADPRVRVR